MFEKPLAGSRRTSARRLPSGYFFADTVSSSLTFVLPATSLAFERMASFSSLEFTFPRNVTVPACDTTLILCAVDASVGSSVIALRTFDANSVSPAGLDVSFDCGVCLGMVGGVVCAASSKPDTPKIQTNFFMMSSPFLLGLLSSPRQAGYERDDEKNEEQEEKDLCDARGRRRHAAETENCGNERDDEEDQCPVQHFNLLRRGRSSATRLP